MKLLRTVARTIVFSPLSKPLLRRKQNDLARGLDPDTATMIALGEVTGRVGFSSGTPAEARQTLRSSVALSCEDPIDDVATRPASLRGAAGDINARLYRPKTTQEHEHGPAVLFIHGGGFVTGDLDTHDSFCRTLAKLGDMRVLAIEPRLAPEHPFPAAYDDALSAFRDAMQNAESFGIDRTRFGVAGDSAGGNLSIGIGLATRRDSHRPSLMMLIYPSCDATMSFRSIAENGKGYLLDRELMHWYMNHYVGPAVDRKDPRLSPYWVDDVDGCPPALVIVAGFDPLREEALAFAERMQNASIFVEVQEEPSLTHGFVLTTGLSRAAKRATDAMCVRAGALLRADTRA